MRRLRIELDGEADELGGPDRGVSMKFFADFATALRNAYQRTAQAIVTGSAQHTGVLPARARDVDLRMVSAAAGSLHMDAMPVDQNPQAMIGAGLEHEAISRMLGDLDRLRTDPDADVPRHTRVLVALAPSSVRQRYSIIERGRTIQVVDLTSSGIDASQPSASATVDRLPATIRGVSWLPSIQVVLEVGGSKVTASATSALLDRALEVRDTEIVATIVRSASGNRLIGIHQGARRFSAPSTADIATAWAPLLHHLAQ